MWDCNSWQHVRHHERHQEVQAGVGGLLGHVKPAEVPGGEALGRQTVSRPEHWAKPCAIAAWLPTVGMHGVSRSIYHGLARLLSSLLCLRSTGMCSM